MVELRRRLLLIRGEAAASPCLPSSRPCQNAALHNRLPLSWITRYSAFPDMHIPDH